MTHELETPEPEAVPLTLPIELAGALLGLERAAAYRAAAKGDLPMLPGGSRKRVLTAKLESLAGRRITLADVRAAEKRIAPKREGFLKYQRDYRAARSAQGRG